MSILDTLFVGDLIEFPHGPYSHWAVYLGDGQVAHLTGVANDGAGTNFSQPEHMFTICGKMFNKAKVRIEDFKKAAAGSKARKNNTRDKTWSPLSPAEIRRMALSQRGRVGYNVWYSNCEHFAKWCRYGISKSDQVDNVITGALVGLAMGLTATIVYAVAGYFKSDKNEQEKKQKATANR